MWLHIKNQKTTPVIEKIWPEMCHLENELKKEKEKEKKSIWDESKSLSFSH